MRSVVAIALGLLVPFLGLAGVGEAQSTIEVQGTIQAVDCDAQTITVDNGGSVNTIAVTPGTAISIDSANVPLCALQQYIGAPITVWLAANGNDFVAAQIEVSGAAYGPASPPPPAPAYEPSPLPIVGVVLGTIVVAGLIFLLVHGPDGGYYRYPYYGAYYHYYYRPYYRPYYGYYPAVCPVVYVPVPIVGIVLGTVVVGGLSYLVARDHDGHFYRYPYYGPYRQYYHAAYQPYHGTYGSAPFNAPIRQGDPRWDGPSHAGGPGAAPAFRGPSQQAAPTNRQPDPRTLQSQPANQPAWRGPSQQAAPTNRQPDPRTLQSQPANQPAWRPSQQTAPTYRQPDPRTFQSPPANQPARRGPSQQTAPTYRQPDPRTLQSQPVNQPAWRGPSQQTAPTYRQPDPRTLQSQPANQPAWRGPSQQTAPTYRQPDPRTFQSPAYNRPAQQPRYNDGGRYSAPQNYRGRGGNCGQQSQGQSCH